MQETRHDRTLWRDHKDTMQWKNQAKHGGTKQEWKPPKSKGEIKSS